MARKPKIQPSQLGDMSEPGTNAPVEGAKPVNKKRVRTTPTKRSTARIHFDRENYPEQVEQLALLGLINDQIAEFFGISTSTFDNWIKRYPEVKQALADGRAKADGKVANALFRRAVGYDYQELMEEKGPDGLKKRVTIKHVPGDVTAQFLWLKNRQPDLWKDAPEGNKLDDTPIGRVEITVVGANVKASNDAA